MSNPNPNPNPHPDPNKPPDNSVRTVFARSAAARALADAQHALASGDFSRAEACALDAYNFTIELSRGAR
jgi:hypothetical protein